MAEIRQELLDELLADYENREDLVGPDGLIKQLFGRLIETAAGAELTEHLGYERGDPAGRGSGNSRNGTTPKTLLTEHGEVPVEMPRDRNSSFEPKIVEKGQTHWDGFDDKIISMYAGGMTVEEIRGHLEEIYGVDRVEGLHLDGDRQGPRRRPGLAEPTDRRLLPRGVDRRAGREGPRRWRGPQPARLSRARPQHGRQERGVGAGHRHRGGVREVLAEGPH